MPSRWWTSPAWDAVKELFWDELHNRVAGLFVPVTVVGSGPNAGAGGSTVGIVVPKLELVGTMQVLLQTERAECLQARILWRFPDVPGSIRCGSAPTGGLVGAVPFGHPGSVIMRQDDSAPPFCRSNRSG